jgi:4'-phosphopantetheinyl transferase
MHYHQLMINNLKIMATDKTLHVWKIPLYIAESQLPQLLTLLNDEEKNTATRFRFDQHRRRYIASHAALRNILAQQLNTTACKIDIHIQENGKPYIPQTPIHFNLTHSKDLALLAISYQGDVGIDLEYLKQGTNFLGIAERFFHPLEVEQLKEMAPKSREKFFYFCWTGKEAYLKAKGVGIANHLKMFSLNFLDWQKLTVLSAEKDLEEFKDWFVYSYQPEERYVSTVVSSATPSSILFHDYNLTNFDS